MVLAPGPTGTPGRAVGVTFPRTGPSQLCVSLGSSWKPLWVQGFIPPALWLWWREVRTPPHQYPLPSLEQFPPVNSPLSLECHETHVHLCVSICAWLHAGWDWGGSFMLGGWGGSRHEGPRAHVRVKCCCAALFQEAGGWRGVAEQSFQPQLSVQLLSPCWAELCPARPSWELTEGTAWPGRQEA